MSRRARSPYCPATSEYRALRCQARSPRQASLIGTSLWFDAAICLIASSPHALAGHAVAFNSWLPSAAPQGTCTPNLVSMPNTPGQLRSPSIMPIEHVGRRQDGLFYIMPLSDGYGASTPTDPSWLPLTLASIIDGRRSEPTWLTSEEICRCVIPILQALQLLSDAELVHRDVKPDNILFLNGTTCLGDISLLGADSSNITQRGTPGYSAPSWFVESGGHPDMYGAATTLYTLLTGNSPDKMGRAAFRWPPQGDQTLSPEQRENYLHLHRVVGRAVEDRPAERFINFTQFTNALAFQPSPATSGSVALPIRGESLGNSTTNTDQCPKANEELYLNIVIGHVSNRSKTDELRLCYQLLHLGYELPATFADIIFKSELLSGSWVRVGIINEKTNFTQALLDGKSYIYEDFQDIPSASIGKAINNALGFLGVKGTQKVPHEIQLEYTITNNGLFNFQLSIRRQSHKASNVDFNFARKIAISK